MVAAIQKAAHTLLQENPKLTDMLRKSELGNNFATALEHMPSRVDTYLSGIVAPEHQADNAQQTSRRAFEKVGTANPPCPLQGTSTELGYALHLRQQFYYGIKFAIHQKPTKTSNQESHFWEVSSFEQGLYDSFGTSGTGYPRMVYVSKAGTSQQSTIEHWDMHPKQNHLFKAEEFRAALGCNIYTLRAYVPETKKIETLVRAVFHPENSAPNTPASEQETRAYIPQTGKMEWERKIIAHRHPAQTTETRRFNTKHRAMRVISQQTVALPRKTSQRTQADGTRVTTTIQADAKDPRSLYWETTITEPPKPSALTNTPL
ncbi:MAG: hypothetical protein HC848_09465 [Limnobacter sp.]|nr:hypothetical protein [Limnobacter sp.]